MSEVSAEARTVPKMATELENGPLEERSPGESCFEKIYPFGSDLELREEYINFFGGLVVGPESTIVLLIFLGISWLLV